MKQDTQNELEVSLQRMGLLHPGEAIQADPLAGGVSSDILRVSLPGRALCFKRALAKLKVAADWRAPVERNHAEVEWMRVAEKLAPGCVPRILGEDEQAGAFAMDYLDPGAHPVWKNQLRDGEIRTETAVAVANAIAAVHAGTAGRAGGNRRRRRLRAGGPGADVFVDAANNDREVDRRRHHEVGAGAAQLLARAVRVRDEPAAADG